VFTSTIEQRKTQNKIKFNAHAHRIAKSCCPVNPNEPAEQFDTAPSRTPKRCINISYATAVASPSPSPRPVSPANNFTSPPPNVDMIDTSLDIPTLTDVNSSRLAELESSVSSIQSEGDYMQSDYKQLRNEFQKDLSGVIQHSKEIRAIHSDISELTTMMQEIRNIILPSAPPLLLRSPFASLRINNDLSSITPVPLPLAAPSSPPRKKINLCNESPSKSLQLMTGDQKIVSGTSLNPRECDTKTQRV
jgi:hypothetical protein